jgi:hypothetical protein
MITYKIGIAVLVLIIIFLMNLFKQSTDTKAVIFDGMIMKLRTEDYAGAALDKVEINVQKRTQRITFAAIVLCVALLIYVTP